MGQYFFQVLTEASVDGVIKYIQEGKCRNIITMAGAGISTCKWGYVLCECECVCVKYM